MSTTYAQRQTTAQKKDAPSAASVLDNSSQSESLQRKADMANNAAQRAEAPRPNNTGMPDNLKSGIESLSGFSMDDVRVHYNSSKPATVQALAYTQGTDIHVAPGQEKHLPHEAWHVAQQMAGRVSPTTNINGMPVNDNAALEHEADVMGEKAVQCKETTSSFIMRKCITCRSVQKKPNIFPIDMIRIDSVIVVESMSPKFTTPKSTTPKSTTPKSTTSSLLEEKPGTDAKGFPLPHIAFEAMAGVDRITQLPTLYNDEIRKYNGPASVFLGVNACMFEKEKSAGNCDQFTLHPPKKDPKLSVEEAASYVIGQLNKKKYHSIIIFTFLYNPVGLLPISGGSISANAEADKTYKLQKGYDFPFYEARSFLMEQAERFSDADFYRWIDSDVTEDQSIVYVNQNGFRSFYCNKLLEPIESIPNLKYDNLSDAGNEKIKKLFELYLTENKIDKSNGALCREWFNNFKLIYMYKTIHESLSCIKPVVFSGYYKWKNQEVPPIGRKDRGNVENLNQILEMINEYERNIRLDYWTLVEKKYKSRGQYLTFVAERKHRKIGFDYGVGCGYIPEPIAYMNANAHGMARVKLYDAGRSNGFDAQDRESDVAFDGLRMCYLDMFAVSKPQKMGYFENVYKWLLEMIKSLRDPVNAKKCLKNALNAIRQTAHLNWGDGYEEFKQQKIKHLKNLVDNLKDKGFLEDVPFEEADYIQIASTSGESSKEDASRKSSKAPV